MKSLVNDCWDEDPSKRPGFYQISMKLKEIKDNRKFECIQKVKKSKSGYSPIFDCGCTLQ